MGECSASSVFGMCVHSHNTEQTIVDNLYYGKPCMKQQTSKYEDTKMWTTPINSFASQYWHLPFTSCPQSFNWNKVCGYSDLSSLIRKDNSWINYFMKVLSGTLNQSWSCIYIFTLFKHVDMGKHSNCWLKWLTVETSEACIHCWR